MGKSSPGSLSPASRGNRQAVDERMSLGDLIDKLQKKGSNLREQAIYSMYHNWLFKLGKIDRQKERLRQQLEKEKQAAKRWYRTATEKVGQPTLKRSTDGTIEGDAAKLKNPELETVSPYEMTKERVPTYISLMQQLYALEALTDSILINMKKRCGPTCQDVTDFGFFQENKSKFRLYAESLLQDLLDHLKGNPAKGIFGLNELSGRKIAKSYMINKLVSFFENYKTAQEYHNILFLGNAGTGKSFLANIFGNILASSGILLTNNVLEKTRSDFVGEYMGQTAIKTNALLSSAFEGVLFFDEAYDIARFDQEKKDWDSYGAEAVTEMIQFLSANKGCIAVFAAGYKKDMLTRFLEINEGMRRRFPQQIYLEDYTWKQLYDMLQKNMQKHYKKGTITWMEEIPRLIEMLYISNVQVPFHYKRTNREGTLYTQYKEYYDLMNKGLPFKYIQDRLKKDQVDVEILNVPNPKQITMQEFNALKYGSSSITAKELLFNNQAGDIQNISDRLLSWLTLTGRSPYALVDNKVQHRDITIHDDDVGYMLYQYGLQKNITIDPEEFMQMFADHGIDIPGAKMKLQATSVSTERVRFERIQDDIVHPATPPTTPSRAPHATTLFQWKNISGKKGSLLDFTPTFDNHILSNAGNLKTFKEQKPGYYSKIKKWYQRHIKKRSKESLQQEFEEKWKAYHQLEGNWNESYTKDETFWKEIHGYRKEYLVDYILWVDWETATCWHEEVMSRVNGRVNMEKLTCREPCNPPGVSYNSEYCKIFNGNMCKKNCRTKKPKYIKYKKK